MILHNLGTFLRRVLGLNRRYGVRWNGGQEKSGFFNRGEAKRWLRERELIGVVYEYEPVDLRLLGGDMIDTRESYRP
jgi:hypothetical protein